MTSFILRDWIYNALVLLDQCDSSDWLPEWRWEVFKNTSDFFPPSNRVPFSVRLIPPLLPRPSLLSPVPGPSSAYCLYSVVSWRHTFIHHALWLANRSSRNKVIHGRIGKHAAKTVTSQRDGVDCRCRVSRPCHWPDIVTIRDECPPRKTHPTWRYIFSRGEHVS